MNLTKNLTSPSAKVVVSTLMAFIVATAIAINEGGTPTTAHGWLTLLARAIGGSALVGGAGYVKAETNPAPSTYQN